MERLKGIPCGAADIPKYSEAASHASSPSKFEVMLFAFAQLLVRERAGPPPIRYPRGVPRAKEGLPLDAITLAIVLTLVVLESRLSVPDP
jgi:hypothetical protein